MPLGETFGSAVVSGLFVVAVLVAVGWLGVALDRRARRHAEPLHTRPRVEPVTSVEAWAREAGRSAAESRARRGVDGWTTDPRIAVRHDVDSKPDNDRSS